MNESILISVIVPVYNVERFITRCAHSLFAQTMDAGVEFIFVDDATPDNSIEALQNCLRQYPQRQKQVKLLRHSVNKGLPAARNTGLQAATGTYIYHCDSDDYLESDALESMYNAAMCQEADIVWCDWYLSFEKKERYMKQPAYDTAIDALKGILSGAMKYNVWNKLVRRQLYIANNIRFPEGHSMGEDMTMIQLFACAGSVCYLPRAFYHYVQQNSGAFCKTSSNQHLEDVLHNVAVVLNDIRQLFGNQLERELAYFQLSVKFPFLISDDPEKYALWQSWYPEANRYIMQNTQLSLRSRCLQWLAWKHQFWAVRLYYVCVHRLMYGVIYR